MEPEFCRRCGWRMRPFQETRHPSHPSRRSRDHILPVERGGKDVLYGDTRNIEIMCQDCNCQRAAVFHCWGAVACIRAVAKDSKTTFDVIYTRWKMGKVRYQADLAEFGDRSSRPAPAVVATKKASSDDDYAWPADTAAKRVWNLATLAAKSNQPLPAAPSQAASD